MDTLIGIEKEIFEFAHMQRLSLSEKIYLIGERVDYPDLTFEDLLKQSKVPSKKIPQAIAEKAQLNIAHLIEEYRQSNIHWLSILHPAYPEYLKQIYQPPIGLFYKGNIDLLKEDKLSIVGSRKATNYGRQVLKQMIPDWVPHFVTVSGLARGIDTMVHNETMQAGGQTIAVIGSGLHRFYPAENKFLQEKIASDHLLLSEYPKYAQPVRHHFPMRNRIIAGLTLGTVVVEAEYKSGSLITAQLALNEGREVFCVPGNITSSLSLGTNHLIQQGAHCVYNSRLIFEIFDPSIEGNK